MAYKRGKNIFGWEQNPNLYSMQKISVQNWKTQKGEELRGYAKIIPEKSNIKKIGIPLMLHKVELKPEMIKEGDTNKVTSCSRNEDVWILWSLWFLKAILGESIRLGNINNIRLKIS